MTSNPPDPARQGAASLAAPTAAALLLAVLATLAGCASGPPAALVAASHAPAPAGAQIVLAARAPIIGDLLAGGGADLQLARQQQRRLERIGRQLQRVVLVDLGRGEGLAMVLTPRDRFPVGALAWELAGSELELRRGTSSQVQRWWHDPATGLALAVYADLIVAYWDTAGTPGSAAAAVASARAGAAPTLMSHGRRMSRNRARGMSRQRPAPKAVPVAAPPNGLTAMVDAARFGGGFGYHPAAVAASAAPLFVYLADPAALIGALAPQASVAAAGLPLDAAWSAARIAADRVDVHSAVVLAVDDARRYVPLVRLLLVALFSQLELMPADSWRSVQVTASAGGAVVVEGISLPRAVLVMLIADALLGNDGAR